MSNSVKIVCTRGGLGQHTVCKQEVSIQTPQIGFIAKLPNDTLINLTAGFHFTAFRNAT